MDFRGDAICRGLQLAVAPPNGRFCIPGIGGGGTGSLYTPCTSGGGKGSSDPSMDGNGKWSSSTPCFGSGGNGSGDAGTCADSGARGERTTGGNDAGAFLELLATTTRNRTASCKCARAPAFRFS